MRYYQLDLPRDLDTHRLTWRRLAVVISYLPREAATVREVRGEAAAWGATEHLLATAVDLLAGANWQRSGSKKIPRPKPLVRPGEVEKKRQKAEEMRERLLEQRRRLGQGQT